MVVPTQLYSKQFEAIDEGPVNAPPTNNHGLRQGS